MIFLLLMANVTYAAPKSDLWPKWEANNAESTEIINHQVWSKFLTEYLMNEHPSDVNRVRYNDVTKSDKELLANYLAYLQGIRISIFNRKEQKAYWINFYNALTVKVILDHYPVKSIRDIDISSGWFSDGPWDAKLMEVEGGKLSLNDIEHRILRPIWQDNRIHYVVNCASIGCPNLLAEVFTGSNSDQLLNQSAIDYINHNRGVLFIAKDEIIVSSIYDWYGVDFGDSEKALVKHLLKFATQKLKNQLTDFDGDIEYDYDWNLNEP
ncbi:MAG: DUF547 domain-containing protein [Deltaproteobacteria bacterium]|nr:DUF547 domain-containing protein [Deltaproteobacteria bacterium]MBT4526075.1 DUF547 domain-containing protein [Deltaproteobacteria bacterium]